MTCLILSKNVIFLNYLSKQDSMTENTQCVTGLPLTERLPSQWQSLMLQWSHDKYWDKSIKLQWSVFIISHSVAREVFLTLLMELIALYCTYKLESLSDYYIQVCDMLLTHHYNKCSGFCVLTSIKTASVV